MKVSVNVNVSGGCKFLAEGEFRKKEMDEGKKTIKSPDEEEEG